MPGLLSSPLHRKAIARWGRPLAAWLFTVLLLTALVLQYRHQWSRADLALNLYPERAGWLVAAVVLMLPNVTLESLKWRLLAGLRVGEALRSVLGGIALGIVTPGRLGEYPGRILFLKNKTAPRLAGAAVLGILSQMLAVLCYGLVVLFWYAGWREGEGYLLLAGGTGLALAFVLMLYGGYHRWAPLLARLPLLRRWLNRGKMAASMAGSLRLAAFCVSALRFGVYTTQLCLLLRWQGVAPQPGVAFGLAALCFFVLAVVPTVALADLGVRGAIAVFLFQRYGLPGAILLATFALWIINLALPALAGLGIIWQRRLKRFNTARRQRAINGTEFEPHSV